MLKGGVYKALNAYTATFFIKKTAGSLKRNGKACKQ
jgi:hypothetical protein